MPSIEFEVWCDTCGEGLCTETTVDVSYTGIAIKVGACSKCLKNEHEEGYDKGHEDGYTEGYDKGHEDGFAEGEKE